MHLRRTGVHEEDGAWEDRVRGGGRMRSSGRGTRRGTGQQTTTPKGTRGASAGFPGGAAASVE